MNAQLQDYCNILRVTTVQRDRRSRFFMAAVAGLLLLAFAILVVVDVSRRHQLDLPMLLRVLAGGGAIWLAIMWSMLFLPGSVLLNTVANARLLPRQRRRLMQLAGAGWLLLTLLSAAVVGKWMMVPIAGLLLLGFALMSTGNKTALVLFLIGTNWPWMSRVLLPSALVEALGSDTSLAVLAVLLLPVLAWSLRWLYPAGGDGHFERRSLQLMRLRRFEGQGWAEQIEGSNPRGWNPLRLYAAALARDCRAPEPGKMLMHALGPAAHSSAWIPSIVLLVGIGIALRLALVLRGDTALRDFVNGGSGAGFSGFVVAIVVSTIQLTQQIGRMRTEQALLRLTPLAGDAKLLNRRLATGLLKTSLGLWLMLTGALLLDVILIVDKATVWVSVLALCCLAGQVAMMCLLGDYARSKDGASSPGMHAGGWSLPLVLAAAVVVVLESAAAFGTGFLLQDKIAGWVCLAVVALALGAFQVQRAWRRMLAAAPAFPARRFD